MVVGFPSSPGARISSYSPAARLRRSGSRLLLTVPASAHSGRIMILLSKRRYTAPTGRSTCTPRDHPPAEDPKPEPAPSDPSVFDGQGCGSGT